MRAAQAIHTHPIKGPDTMSNGLPTSKQRDDLDRAADMIEKVIEIVRRVHNEVDFSISGLSASIMEAEAAWGRIREAAES